MENALERATLSKVTRRLIPFMFLLYVFNYLDRLNISYAALTMKQDLGFNDSAYGVGAGIFFLGYFLFEIPSNLILERVGARLWIARIMLTWGVIASTMLFVKSPTSFYLLRFLLGVAEAGFFPGMVLYLTYWFPASIRARAAARFMVATTFAGIVGGPLASLFLKMNGWGGLKGWQWLFLLEGLPSFLLGFAALFYLTDRPEQANWLRPEERVWLAERIGEEQARRRQHHDLTLLQGLTHPKVLSIGALFFLMQLCGYSLGFWSPQIIKLRSDWSDTKVLWIGALPGIVGAISMLMAAAHSDRTRDRRKHLAAGLFVGAIGVLCSAYTGSPVYTIAAFALIALGTSAANGPFWAICTSFLSGTAAAGGIALINSIGNLGGVVGPTLMGILKERTGGYATGLIVLACIWAFCALLGLFAPHDPALEHGGVSTPNLSD